MELTTITKLFLSAGLGMTAVCALTSMISRSRMAESTGKSPFPDFEDAVTFGQRYFDNLLCLVGVSFVASYEKTREISNPGDGQLGAVLAILMLVTSWHFFFRYKRFIYRIRKHADLAALAIPFRYWKISLAHSAISFVGCCLCAFLITR